MTDKINVALEIESLNYRSSLIKEHALIVLNNFKTVLETLNNIEPEEYNINIKERANKINDSIDVLINTSRGLIKFLSLSCFDNR